MQNPFIRLWGYAVEQRPMIIWAVISSILNKLFDLMPPLLIGAAVDVVVSQENSFLAQWGIIDVNQQIWFLAGATILIWGLESAFEYAFDLLWRHLAQRIQHELRVDAYAHIQKLEMGYFEDQSTGGLMSILNNDINQLERFLDSGANNLIQVITTVVVIGGMFIVLIPSVAWMALIPMPFVFLGSIWFQKRIEPKYQAVREQTSILNSQLANNLSGIATIKSFTTEQYEISRIQKESEGYRARNSEAIWLSAAFVPLIRMVIVVGFTSILVFGGQMAVAGSLNVGTYSVLVFLTQRLLWPLTRLGTTLDMYQRAMASTKRVLGLLDTKPEILPGVKELQEVRGEVTLNNLSFAYGGRVDTLKNLSLHVPAGTTAAIVGATGSGKSTIVKLLLRLYEAAAGEIMIDQTALPELTFDSLRGAIGYVSQDVYLFHGTVRENIAYGSFGADIEAIEQAAKIAEADQFICELPDGYDTVVGERGQKLSGGQRQRISIARAVLKDPPILILDEATSAVDNETEAAIQRSMARITANRTTIVIAHRLSTVRYADQIFVLDNGRLVENGTHEQLLELQKVYYSLWRVQTGELEQDQIQV